MTEIELESTYLVRQLPSDLVNVPSTLVTDIYFPADSPHPNLRLRQKGERYEITKKIPVSNTDASQQTEETIPLTKAEFTALAQSGGKRVSKHRYEYLHQGKVLEIDVFLDSLQGLVLADAEFNTRAEQAAFAMPDFCLVEITQEEIIAGGKLAGKSYGDIADKLSGFGYTPLTGVTND